MSTKSLAKMTAFVYQIDDEFHDERIGDTHRSYESALQEVQRFVDVPFGVEPNCPPCTNWRKCQREYVIKKYEVNTSGRRQLVEETPVATVSAEGVIWHLAQTFIDKPKQIRHE
jgi:hypothetical protein